MTITEDRPSRRWLDALRASSLHLEELAEGRSEHDLERPSFTGGWTVAQVLSHLGSGAEICSMLVRRGLDGDDRGPVREEVAPIWERWDALSPVAQRDAWREADAAHLALLSSITPEREAELRIPYFAGPLSLETYLGYRLSEHAVHGWDIDVAFDPCAVVRQLPLLWERLDLIAGRFHDKDVLASLPAQQIVLVRRDADAIGVLTLGAEGVSVRVDEAPTDPRSTVVGTSDSLLRLFYGRSRTTDDLQVAGSLDRDQLTGLFPGF